MNGAKETIIFATSLHTEYVAIPAALFALNVLTHPEISLLKAKDGVKEESVLGLTEREQEEVYIFFSLTDENDMVTSGSAEGLLSGSEYIDKTTLLWLKEVIQTVDQLSLSDAIKVIEQREEAIFIRMGELIEVFQKLFGPKILDGRENKKQVSVDFESPKVDKKEEEAVKQFVFAYTFWLLLKLDSYYQSLEGLRKFIVSDSFLLQDKKSKRTPLNLLEKLKIKIPEGLVQKEQTQWLLLAIIWNLAMKREAGIYQSSNNTKGIKKKQVSTSTRLITPILQPAGTIFVFA
jgi:hypothetical protein